MLVKEKSATPLPLQPDEGHSRVSNSSSEAVPAPGQGLDYVAAELAKLQAQDVPVLWAPFHEVQPAGWFWWAKGSGPQFIALWKYMYEYLTNTKKLNNLVWLMPFSGSPSAAYYPGKQYLDLSGPDTYAENEPFTSMFNIWSGYQSDGTHNTTANIKSVYDDPRTVTRDEVPNLK